MKNYARKFTDEQIKAALDEGVAAGWSRVKMAEKLGLTERNFRARVYKLAKQGHPTPSLNDAHMKRRGYSPEHDMVHVVPEGYKVKGVSTYYNSLGIPTGQWVKSSADEEKQRAIMQAAIAEMAETVRGIEKPVKAPTLKENDKLATYVIGDAHFGMYSWHEETGEDFDTAIASKDLRDAVDILVAGAPPASTGYLVDVGDFLHADNRSNMTPASGNILDVDSRFQRVIRVAISALKYCIARMLQKHSKVKVFITPGNHNPDSAGWMAMVLAAVYENEPRIEIETSPSKFFYQMFGEVLIGITHGDKIKMADLPSIMAYDRSEDWGKAKHRYWLTGHVHHTKNQEYRGCFVESFNTLAATDAWHAASGYRSQRQMQRIDIDSKHGIYGRGIVNVGMLRNAA